MKKLLFATALLTALFLSACGNQKADSNDLANQPATRPEEGAELDPEVYPVYTRLAQDPRSLLDFCKAKGFPPKSSYYNRCHLCQDMRLFLYRNFPGAFPELAPASFYEAVIAEN